MQSPFNVTDCDTYLFPLCFKGMSNFLVLSQIIENGDNKELVL